MARFKYVKRGAEGVEKRAKQTGFAERDSVISDDLKSFSPAKGSNNIRIMPPSSKWNGGRGDEHYGHDVHMHYNIGSDNGMYVCPSKHGKGACPICEERKVAEDAGDDELAKRYRTTKRVAVLLIDRDKEEDGVKMWLMPWTVDRDVSMRCKDKRTGEILYIDDPFEGYDIFFQKEGKAQQTKYIGIEVDRANSPIKARDSEVDEIMEFVEDHPIPEQIVVHDYDKISNAMLGGLSATSGSSEKGSSSSRHSSEDDSKSSTTDLTWESLHEMSLSELDKVSEDNSASVYESEYSDASDMADALCEELGIDEPKKSKRSKPKEDDQDEDQDEVPFDEDEDPKEEKKSRVSGRLSKRLGRK